MKRLDRVNSDKKGDIFKSLVDTSNDMIDDAVSKVNFNSLRFMYESRSQIFMSIVSHPFNVHSHKR